MPFIWRWIIFEKDDYSKLDQIEILEQHVDDHEKDLINNHIERIMNSMCIHLVELFL